MGNAETFSARGSIVASDVVYTLDEIVKGEATPEDIGELVDGLIDSVTNLLEDARNMQESFIQVKTKLVEVGT